MPLSFLLDIDAQRRYINGYREHKEESHALSYIVSKGIIDAYLKEGHNVVLDKVMVKDEALGQIQPIIDLGEHHGAEVFEFILTCSKEELQRRADARGYRKGGLLTPDMIGPFWEQTQKLIRQRPDATIINTDKLSAEATFKKVMDCLESFKGENQS